MKKINKNGEITEKAMNSCLIPLATMDEDHHITTVEGFGDCDNLNAVQERFVSLNGSQCGFCTPGFISSLSIFLQNNPNPSIDQLNTCLDNYCRCTGKKKILSF